jgi:hypothetical protein
MGSTVLCKMITFAATYLMGRSCRSNGVKKLFERASLCSNSEVSEFGWSTTRSRGSSLASVGSLRSPRCILNLSSCMRYFTDLYERDTRQEMARASIAEARRHEGFAPIIASVDEVNAASLRILEKLGFKRITTLQGAFGNMFLLRLDNEIP